MDASGMPGALQLEMHTIVEMRVQNLHINVQLELHRRGADVY